MKTLSTFITFFICISFSFSQHTNTRGKNSSNTIYSVADVTISGSDTICQGVTLNLIATTINGGSSPNYQWFLNGDSIYNNNDTLLWSSISNNDTIYCVLTSSDTSLTNLVDTSNIIIISVLAWDTASISYPASTYCNIGNDPAPTITGTLGGLFYTIPSGLTIDWVSGSFYLGSSLPNNYTIYYTTQSNCPDTATFNINIVTALTANFSYINNAFCDTSINSQPLIPVGSAAGVFSASPAGLVFVDSLTGEIDLQSSQNGFYTIKNLVSTSGVCPDSATVNISIGIGVKDTATISYPTNTYCNLGTTPPATITGSIGGTYSILPSINLHNGDGTIYLNGVAAGNYSVIYTTNGLCPTTDTFDISVINSPGSHFQYSSTLYCTAQSNPIPVISQGSVSGVFTASPAGLVFSDSLTGEIDLATSQPGNYFIKNKVAANGICPADSTNFQISIISPAQSSNFSYSYSQICSTPGGFPLTSPPNINGLQGGIFSSSPIGLSIDSLTGRIDRSQSNTIGTYTITYTVSGACASSSTFTMKVQNQLNPIFSYTDTCKGVAMSFLTPALADSSLYNFFSFNCQPANSSNNYQFNSNGQLWLINTDPGTYYISGYVFHQYCPSASYSDTVTIHDCVWPGDANNDKEVWPLDLLSIGLYYSETGIPRINPTNQWQPQLATNWGTQTVYGSDKKHVDCNGDGAIDYNDTVAINLNFNSGHLLPPFNPAVAKASDPALYFVTQNNVYYPGDWVTAELWLGSASQSVTNFYGLSFFIQYKSHLLENNLMKYKFDSINWTGTNGLDALQMYVNNTATDHITGSITRIDHINASGYGKIGELTFQINSGIDSITSLYLSFPGIWANDSIGDSLKLNPISKSLTITPLTSISSINYSPLTASIYPNPFTQQTTISLNKELNHGLIKVMDVLGKEIKQISFSGRKIIIDKEELKCGVYFIQIIDENKNSTIKKIIIQE